MWFFMVMTVNDTLLAILKSSFTCQFSQLGPIFMWFFYGDDPAPTLADTNIWLIPNKGDILSSTILPKSACMNQ